MEIILSISVLSNSRRYTEKKIVNGKFYLDEVRHGKVDDIVTPSEFQNHIRMEKVIALEEAARETVEITLFQEPSQKLFSNFSVLRLSCVFHGIFEQLVLLAQLDRLFPAIVALVQVCGNAAKFNQFVFF